jgi:uncharacterized membrane protein YbhN (UPF0104 family)
VAAMMAVYIATRIVDGDVLRVALLGLGHRIGHYRAFLLAMVMTYTNLIVPRAGMGAPAIYLKHRMGVAYADFFALLIPTVVLQMLAVAVCGLACQAALSLGWGHVFHKSVAALFAGTILASLAVLYAPMPRGGRGRVAQFLHRLVAAWQRLMGNGALAWRIFAAQLVICLLCGVRLHLAFTALGVSVNFFAAMLMSMLAQMTILIAITPGAMGVREAAILLAAPLLGALPAGTLGNAVALDRLVWMIAVVGIGQWGAWRLVRPPGPAADACAPRAGEGQ